MKRAAGEGQVHLDAQLQAEYYKIQEEAKSKTSRLRTDHEALRAAQVPSAPPALLHEALSTPIQFRRRSFGTCPASEGPRRASLGLS